MSTDQGACIVTGGAGAGIGSGISRVLAGDGWPIVVADVDAKAGERLVDELRDLGQVADFVHADLRDPESMRGLVDDAARRHGSIRGLVNSAGVGAIGRTCDVSEEAFDRIIDIDLRGAWRMIRLVVPHMLRAGGGAIVNIGSVHSSATHPGWSVYSAAKAGLEALTRGVAADYGPGGVRCNIVHPGLVDSAQNREAFTEFGDPEEFMTEWVSRSQMLPVAIEPVDIGRAVAFLLGDGSRAITGVALTVDGGSQGQLFDNDSRILAMLDRLGGEDRAGTSAPPPPRR